MSSRCKTINLAVISLDTLKKMESQIPKPPRPRPKDDVCSLHERIPPPPGPVSMKKIIVCTPTPIQYQCHPVPCVCPPCPPCETHAQKLARLVRTGVKLFVFYSFVKWTVDQNLWNGHNGTARITLDIMEKNFPNKGGIVSLPNIQYFKYCILNAWDKAVGNFFYYILAMPLKMLSTSYEERKIEKLEQCKCP